MRTLVAKQRLPTINLRIHWITELTHGCRPLAIAACLFSLLCALISIWYGQDTNWDLQNYHLYNAYAFLGGRVGRDWAPAQLQTYFNPLLDLPYYWMMQHWPGRWVAGLMGAIHGLAFALLAALGWHFSRNLKYPRVWAFILGLVGCISPVFVAELGSTMNDNMTALLVLAALLLLVTQWQSVWHTDWYGAWVPLLAGFLLGAAAGLKLTNFIYALAACIALPLCFGPWRLRVRSFMIIGSGVAFGLTATSGFWFWKMWHLYGDPLFPMAAADVPNAYTQFLPKSWLEAMFYPLVFTLQPGRIGEFPLRQIISPSMYVLFAAWASVASLEYLRAVRGVAPAKAVASMTLKPEGLYLLLFVALSYLFWLKAFGYNRYFITLELLAPLIIWLLLCRLCRPTTALRISAVVFLSSVTVALRFHREMGHAAWTEGRNYALHDPPIITHAEGATLIFVGGQPMGWLAPLFPSDLIFVSLAGNFPESPSYQVKLREVVRTRGGPIYVVLPASISGELAENQGNVAKWTQYSFQQYGLLIDAPSCIVKFAYIGQMKIYYQFCLASWPT
jgi:hypothetical protein